MTPSILRALGAALLLAAGAAFGQSAAHDAEQKAAFEAADKAKIVGPATVALRDQASLKLPEGYLYIPTPAATQVMQAMGNRSDPRLVGVVFPAANDPWFVAIKFVQEGYVKDDDARDWKPDDLLDSLREGTEAANAERTKRGFPAIDVVGWAEPPRYDSATHRLVWSASSRERGQGASADQGVNYNTYALGREGYISLNLITDLDKLATYRPNALQLLGALEYNEGKRYADFNGSTDKVAAYGLATLVAGAAAKKLGFFALLLAFAAKFAKVLVVAGGALVWGLLKFFGRRKPQPEPVEPREPVLNDGHTRPGAA
ncbi:MAG TPA: DUF2167 domain-containing protein [Ramlibacter sp.]